MCWLLKTLVAFPLYYFLSKDFSFLFAFVELSYGHSRYGYIYWLRITQMTLEGNWIFPASLSLDFSTGTAGNNNTVTLASGLATQVFDISAL